jgi:hypothetical protein
MNWPWLTTLREFVEKKPIVVLKSQAGMETAE